MFLVPFVLALVTAFVLLPLATLTGFLLTGLAQSLGYSPQTAKSLLKLGALIPTALIFILALVLVVRGYLQNEIQITQAKLTATTGFVSRIHVSLQTADIQDVEVHRPRLGRRLDYATIIVTDRTGASYTLPFVRSPDQFLASLDPAGCARRPSA